MTDVISIIAVQGLGASPYFTWVKKVAKAGLEVEEVMWLRDLLPNFVPNARIATFSYLSDWYTYKKGVQTSIRELGEQLLMALHHNRQSTKVRDSIYYTYLTQAPRFRYLGDPSYSLDIAWVGWSSNKRLYLPAIDLIVKISDPQPLVSSSLGRLTKALLSHSGRVSSL